MTRERMGGNPSRHREQWTYDRAYPHRFEEKLVRNGYDILARTPDKIRVAIPAGQHELTVGFPELDLASTTYHYGNNPVEMQNRPLILDYKHPAFQDLLQRFRGTVRGSKPFVETMVALDGIIQDSIRSNSATERIGRISEIIENHASVCAGKVLVAESLLKHQYGDKLSIQEVHGTNARIGNKRTHDINHIWLRVAYGGRVALYDPYYQHISFYDTDEGKITTSHDDPFTRYEVEGAFLGAISETVRLKSFSGVRAVDTIHNGIKEFFVEPNSSLTAQINNSINIKFSNAQPGQVDLFNGGIKCTHDYNNDRSAGYTYPVQGLKQAT